MRLLTCRHEGRERVGVLEGDTVVLPSLAGAADSPSDMLAVIEGGAAALAALGAAAAAAPAGCRVPLGAVEVLAPIPRPRTNVICLGWNYVEHVKESAAAKAREDELPEHPVVFTKAVSSVTGPYADVVCDAAFSTQIDWEVELGVVIGRGGRRIAARDALDHVFGYTVINDISVRDVQFRHKQFYLGKSMDGGCPMGPWIVTADEIPDPQRLDLACRVNDVVKQSSSTRHQIFDVATTIEALARGMTLRPGDVVATGTPSGVGFARRPPEFLHPGDVVECEIEGIGVIRNRMVAPA